MENTNRSFLQRMQPRDPHEHPRAATPLELLFDLCFVVAIAQAASKLHHSVAEGHTLEGAMGFGIVFLAIWWAWMGFTWFASAFDTDDPLYRLKVLVQMVGVLVLAAGVPRAFDEQDFSLLTLGYAIMRIGLVAQWLRAAKSHPSVRQTALRYAGGITLLQVGWIGLLAVPPAVWIWGWGALILLEFLVPWWAEKAGGSPWHVHHIAERYGLLTIIVIGESVLAATLAIQSALDLREVPGRLMTVVASAPVILFAMWWLYFSRPAHRLLTSTGQVFVWGYGHYFVFAAAAATGAGLAVLVDSATGHAHISAVAAGYALTVPVALYLVSLWVLHNGRASSSRLEIGAFPLVSGLVLLAPLTGYPAVVVAVLLTVLTAISVRASAREGAEEALELSSP